MWKFARGNSLKNLLDYQKAAVDGNLQSLLRRADT
jgi:hypothetical protein